MTTTETVQYITLPTGVPSGIASRLLELARDAIVEAHTAHWNTTTRSPYRKTDGNLAFDSGRAFGACDALLSLGALVRGLPASDVYAVHEGLVGDLIREGRLVRDEEDGEPVHPDHSIRETTAGGRAKTRP